MGHNPRRDRKDRGGLGRRVAGTLTNDSTIPRNISESGQPSVDSNQVGVGVET